MAERGEKSVNRDSSSERVQLLPRLPSHDAEGGDAHGAVESNTSSSLGTAFNFFKGMVASGFLSLPFALENSGYVTGTIIMIFIGLVSLVCMHLLVWAKQKLCHRLGYETLTYGDVAFLTLGPWGRWGVDVSLLITQIGFCCVYVLFISETLNQLQPALKTLYYSLLIFPVFIVLSWIKSLKVLAPASGVANFCIFFIATVILVYDANHMGEALSATNNCHPWGNMSCIQTSKPLEFANIKNLPIFFGNSIYSFEGIGLVLPLENAIIDKSKYGLVVNLVMMVVIVLYVAFAICGYLVFGGSTSGSITLNLPNTGIYMAVKIALIAALFQSYTIQFYPAINIIEGLTMSRFKNGPIWKYTFARNTLRALIVAFTVCFAIAIPQLGLVISLIGSLGSGALALIFPPLLYIYSCKSYELPRFILVSNWAIVIFGVIGSITGTVVAIMAIVEAF